MDVVTDWELIRKHFNQAFRSNFYISIASIDAENKPTNTPIGSLFLNNDQCGFYFEKYPSKLPIASDGNSNICALAVKSGRLYWLRSLFAGKFKSHPAMRLYGKLGQRRKADEKEIKRLQRRMKTTKGLKGNAYLWSDMQDVREVVFEKVETVNLGKMTSHL
jgi:hypothetical protein